ncbi:sensor histidine kinase [Carboxylicivirga marina]|uniref:histidine kinase n=1 Tax=Carboxylicivirga marina TaxID=2800988 RepID=A0ABS1HQ86_9BACT|nr:HAMP domain-containing sensor histidine kinase [Carboxylicivirga marina]MBK3519785.1 GHKL domain-containing protein [Carboxylicivirga marina]
MSRQQPKLLTTILIALSLFTIGKLVEYQFDHSYSHEADTYSIQQTIKNKQNTLIHDINKISDNSLWNKESIWINMDSLAHKDNHYYLYKDSSLIAWSTHTVPLDKVLQESKHVIQLSNGWFLYHRQKVGEYTLLGLSLIKEEYEYQNKFLSNRFDKVYTITHHPQISLDDTASEHVISDIYDNYLLTLVYNHHQVISPTSITAFVLYILCFIILTLLAIRVLQIKRNKSWSNHLLFGITTYFTLLCFLFENYAIPSELSYHDMFSPLTFAVSDILSSLGSLLILSVFFLTFAYCFYRYYKAPSYLNNKSISKQKTYLLTAVRLLVVMTLFLLINDLLRLLVTNSSQASIFFNIEDLNAAALYKLFILCILYSSIIFIFERLIVTLKEHLSLYEYLAISALVYLILLAISYLFNQPVQLLHFIIFAVISSILYKAQRNRNNGITYSSFIWVIFATSFYAVTLLYTYNIEKEKNNRSLLIDNLSFELTRESDPIAEMNLSEIEKKIKKDDKLISLLVDLENKEEDIIDYLEKTYFSGYWKRYDIEIVVCWKGAELYIESENITTNCYNYFNELITNQGQMLDSCTYFHFLNNENGQVSYFGKIPLLQLDDNLETTIFCDINSTPIFSGLGYPELLQNQEQQVNNAIYKNYSYAKYINNSLIKQFGSYSYPINYHLNKAQEGDKITIREDNMVHLVYQLNSNTTLVLSRPEIKRIYLLMSFSTFALLFLIITALIFYITRTHKNAAITFSIQEKIQIAFVSLMVIILLVLGISSVFYSVHQFKAKNNQMLSQRIKSVLQEMEQKIVNEPHLDESMHDYLQYLMQKFSNVFYSDINLYNTNGELLATSRPELYQQGLSGKMMNTEAYYKLAYDQKPEYIHEEYIGDLHFTSAYVPIYNIEQEVLAYLNLPYFVGNNELKTEVSSLIVAVINAYLLFVLIAIGVAVVISRRITRPLFIIQDRLAQIRIDKLNQKIGYKGNDEIGNLVKEYNRMVDEISDSAEKLAKSEREMAWREMAKQIAHEIKNPLTPMKLSVQYLTKAWDNQREDFDNFLKRVSTTLIEQIDQLSIIANEFSNFAKMPQAKRDKMDIIDKLINTSSLFDKSEKNIHFTYDIDDSRRIVFADPDQMVSVFNNIIKNAVQAIPNNREGLINISAKPVDTNIQIAISDNGRGISSEALDKIFMPNFTTKTSGMGLGLAIVKNIVINSGGDIWFETTANIGSTFYLQFPLADIK